MDKLLQYVASNYSEIDSTIKLFFSFSSKILDAYYETYDTEEKLKSYISSLKDKFDSSGLNKTLDFFIENWSSISNQDKTFLGMLFYYFEKKEHVIAVILIKKIQLKYKNQN